MSAVARFRLERLFVGGVVAAAMVVATSSAQGAEPRRTKVSNGVTSVVVAKVTPSTFKGPGPYAVGEVTLTVAVASEGYTTPVEVWYPAAKTGTLATYNTGSWFPQPILGLLAANPKLMATATASSGGVRNATAAKGVFPLVLFSHGWAGFRDQSTFLTSHLASWGFVVAAPDHPSRDLTEVLGTYVGLKSPTTDPYADVQDLLATRSFLRNLTVGPLKSHVDASRFVIIGHSAGAVAAEELSSMETSQSAQFHTINPDLGFIALAGASTAGLSPPLPTPYDTVPSEPAIFVKAQNDQVVPGFFENITYNVLTAPHRLISIGESGHLVFTDTCETIPHTGVLPALLSGLKISIPASFREGISDGCAQPNIAVTRAWPAINQVVVAGVRWMFGFDATQGGLNNLGAAYGRKIVPLDTTAPMK